eukprot:g30710.t1
MAFAEVEGRSPSMLGLQAGRLPLPGSVYEPKEPEFGAVVLAPLEMAFSYAQTITSMSLAVATEGPDWSKAEDMLVAFNVATSSHGRLETDRKVLARNYAKSWLVPDLLINFPWDVEPGKTRKIAKILKLPKVFRVTRLFRAAGEEAHFFGTAANIGGILLMGHYLSCFWVMLLIDCTPELDTDQLCPDMLTAYLQGLSIGMSSLGGSDSEFVEIEIFAAQDRIICAGDLGTELYFVAVGEVEVVLPDPSTLEKGTVIKVLHEGSFFGELGLLFPDSKHKVDVYGATSGWLLVGFTVFWFVALERLRKQPEMGAGMMTDLPAQADETQSQHSGSEEWNPHTDETHPKGKDAETQPRARPSQETAQEAKSPSSASHAFRKSRSLSFGALEYSSMQGEDLPAQLKRLTCHTALFRSACMFHFHEPCPDVSGGHGAVPLLQTLHKVEDGMNTLLEHMHTIEMDMIRGAEKDKDPPSTTRTRR